MKPSTTAKKPLKPRKDVDLRITPEALLRRLGPFDLDPCANTEQPWPTAATMINERDDGLVSLWHGMVWLSPPYARRKDLAMWLERMALYNQGIALLYAQTDSALYQEHVWPVARAYLFLRERIVFHLPDGNRFPAGLGIRGPLVLVAYGDEAAARLARCRDLGALLVAPPAEPLHA